LKVTARTPGKIAVFFGKNEQTGCLREQNLQYGCAFFAVLIKNTAIFPGVRAVTIEILKLKLLRNLSLCVN